MNIKLLPNDGDVLRVEIIGNVTRDAWPAGRDLLAEHCGAGIYRHVVLLSLRESLYVDSSGVDWMINCHRRFEQEGGQLVLHSLTPASNQLLKMMRLDRVLHLEPNEAAALARIRAAAAEKEAAEQNHQRSNGSQLQSPDNSKTSAAHEHGPTQS